MFQNKCLCRVNQATDVCCNHLKKTLVLQNIIFQNILLHFIVQSCAINKTLVQRGKSPCN